VGVDATVSPDASISLPSDSSPSPSASADSSADTQADASIDGSAKGLDRADEVAGIHGEQGRDNAREKQDRN